MILLDTHIWIWWIQAPERLKPTTLHYLDSLPPSEIFINVISCWEVAKLVEKNKIELSESVSDWLANAVNRSGITIIPLEQSIIVDACNLPGTFHNDPADQLIVATARVKKLPLLTADGKILTYGFVQLYKE
ncbi:type II toxin-antitoxin system VapC family toxin [Larkinella knui]|uniref:Type II toxin-antitoxin system VapC family toxin n=1 Tax=Larkinella knui TaxID=2025310 RepID=A0A3P1CC14_9BACT|nr:type II toxin-antitoxin system VapC family toxin [Larkinella knui]RRB10861.1 type II toxin-antitoxin system VapC family toxin [Larkinella knui]